MIAQLASPSPSFMTVTSLANASSKSNVKYGKYVILFLAANLFTLQSPQLGDSAHATKDATKWH